MLSGRPCGKLGPAFDLLLCVCCLFLDCFERFLHHYFGVRFYPFLRGPDLGGELHCACFHASRKRVPQLHFMRSARISLDIIALLLFHNSGSAHHEGRTSNGRIRYTSTSGKSLVVRISCWAHCYRARRITHRIQHATQCVHRAVFHHLARYHFAILGDDGHGIRPYRAQVLDDLLFGCEHDYSSTNFPLSSSLYQVSSLIPSSPT